MEASAADNKPASCYCVCHTNDYLIQPHFHDGVTLQAGVDLTDSTRESLIRVLRSDNSNGVKLLDNPRLQVRRSVLADKLLPLFLVCNYYHDAKTFILSS